MAKKTTVPRKLYEPKFKAEVVIDALSLLHTVEAVAKKHGINKTQVNLWRNHLRDNAIQVFAQGKQSVIHDNSEEISRMKEVIGDLTMENALLKKNYVNARKAATGADRMQPSYPFHCAPVQNIFHSSQRSLL